MHGVAVVALPIAILASVLNHRPLLGLGYCLDMGLVASATALVALSPSAALRGRPRPFTFGFVIAGWAAAIAYVGCCASFPDVMVRPALYYLNEIEPRFMDADTLTLYSVSLVVQGLIMTIPQFIFALSGGLLAKLAARRRLSGRPSGRPATGVVS
jgi:hypothetical protein